MTMWLFMLATALMIPAVMMIFGVIFSKKAPDEINSLYGYRTAMSMKNRDTWEFAHKCIGKVWLIGGVVLLLPTIAAMAMVFAHSETLVSAVGLGATFAQLAVMLLSIIPVEIALHKTFDQDGNRK